MSTYLKLENISKYYTSGQSVVMGLQGISLEFSLGEFVAITGESGSGKSTLAKVVAGILPYEGGEMSLGGKPTSHYGQSDWEQYRSSRVSFISQSYDILPGCTVLKNVVSALVLNGMDRVHARKQAEEILARVELADMKKRRAAKLSSGQKQRLSIARALAKPAPILIADEPTGNLDSENSAKVVRLLADAAKERLVLMVTHDFEEVEDAASRRIIIRDGAVDADMGLGGKTRKDAAHDMAQEKDTQKKPSQNAEKGKTGYLSRYTAALQISSRPVWSAVMLLFFALTAFALFVFAGTFVVNLDDSFTRMYDNSAFLNGSKTRIVVMKEDGNDMGKEDYNALLALSYVERIERFGFISDIHFYYRDGIDYNKHYEAVVDDFGNPLGLVETKLTLGDTNLFLQTVPCLKEGAHFLTAGRMPENMYEVVFVGDEELLGTSLTFYVCNKKLWPVDSYLKLTAKIVGVTDVGEHFYVDGQLGRAISGEYLGGELLIAPTYETPDSNRYVTGDDPLEKRFLCSEFMLQNLKNQIIRERINKGQGDFDESIYYKKSYPFSNPDDPENPIKLKIYGSHSSSYNQYILVKPDVFEQLVPDREGTQISLTITDYAYTDRVLEAVHGLGYQAISPYRLGSTKQNEKLAAERLQTLKICILATLAVFFLQILVLRAMFGMETMEFKLLANLGLRCRTAKRSVLWQVFAFTVSGQLLAFVAAAIASQAGVERILNIVKYLPVRDILLFMLLHLAAGLLVALWVQRVIGRQVYPASLPYADLDMDEEEDQ
ncbi:MAG: ABC transporter ATP-binding protein [Lachnospiraceae bacterium]|nr:ABC transporter ATP-binding protein [Lachnospiraceae bacterium]